MKINERDALNLSKPQSNRLHTEIGSGGSLKPAESSHASGDGIELKGQADLLSQAQTAGARERESNIERLQALIQSGAYHTDTAALSNAIVSGTVNGY